MAEKNVIVITSALNINALFNEFLAAKGVFPLLLSLSRRFPFYDNVFNIIRASSGSDVGRKPEKLEFLMFDVDRILRAGGLVWVDSFYCTGEEKKKKTLTQLIERIGNKKLKRIVGEKADAFGLPICSFAEAVEGAVPRCFYKRIARDKMTIAS